MTPEATILVQLNGEVHPCPDGLRLDDALRSLGFDPRLVVVEFNGEILPRRLWPEQAVRAGDALEVVTIVGGGS